METGKNRFVALSALEQATLLLEILKAFKCNVQKPNLTAIGGAKGANAIAKSKNIGGFSTAYLINQSVTGVYENKVNLLE